MPPDDTDSTYEWRARAARAAPLIDGVDYYRAIRSAFINARRHILVLGWEFHSEIDLLRGDDANEPEHPDYPVRLADLLTTLVEERSELRVDLLIWEGASLFALERQHIPRMKRPWNKHPRLRLVWDRTPPRLASHHQKIVTVDDRIAFVGGMDLTKSRWDTHEHRPGDERRRTPGLIANYANPYHDAMLLVDDEAADTLASWARERWRRATSDTLEAPAVEDDHDPWPDHVEPRFTDTHIEFARTEPDTEQHDERRQVERAFLRQIAGAQRLIYIETQYLAADTIADALRDRLREDDPPEVILIMPPGCPGRLQSLSMDTKRDELFKRLRDADHAGRFRAWWPTLASGETDELFANSVYVHAKILITDDTLLRIGSANLNNRSMGLDTELDATLRADSQDDEEAIRALRRRLLAWFLDRSPDDVARAEDEHDGRVIPAIESLTDGPRTLHPFRHRRPPKPPGFELSFPLADPDRPPDDFDADRALELLTEHTRLRARLRLAWNTVVGTLRRHMGPIVLALALLALALAWRLTPLHTLLDRARIEELFTQLASTPAGLIGVALLFAILASVGAPVTLLIVAVGTLFPAPHALAISTAAVLVSSLPAFAIGRRFPGRIRQRTGEDRLQRIRATLERNAIVGVAILRNLPVAPFAVANAALGVVGIPALPYLVGTLLGMAPGIVLLTLMGERVTAIITDPTPTNILLLAGAIVVVIALAIALQRLLNAHTEGE